MGKVTLAFLAVLSISVMTGSATNDILQNVLRAYDKGSLPRQGSATEVQLGMYVNQMSIKKDDRTMTLDIFMRQKWNDPRLAYHTQGSDTFRVPYYAINEIWKPDIFFRSAKNIQMFREPEPNFLMKLSPNGDVWYVYRAIVDFYCPVLGQYRHSTTCPVMFESFGYQSEEMSLAWLSSPVDVDPNIRIADYTLKDSILYDCTQNYTSGLFPCLETNFLLESDLLANFPSKH